MPSSPTIIQSDNLSLAWARAFKALLVPGGGELTPLIVSLSGFADGVPLEVPAIRSALDVHLVASDKYTTHTTGNLIFPENLWLRYRTQGRAAFFKRYLEVTLPRLKHADARNAKGTYFGRMLDYGTTNINQLAHIIDTRLSGNSRRSALQLMIFDPTTDHLNSPYLPFPCLDHVAFTTDKAGGLSLTAFYATHYIYDRAYGNYLGLCALGRFVAEQLSLEFRQLTCVAGVAVTGGDLAVRAARVLAAAIDAATPQQPSSPGSTTGG